MNWDKNMFDMFFVLGEQGFLARAYLLVPPLMILGWCTSILFFFDTGFIVFRIIKSTFYGTVMALFGLFIGMMAAIIPFCVYIPPFVICVILAILVSLYKYASKMPIYSLLVAFILLFEFIKNQLDCHT
jgi:hypothetical protein